MSEEDGITRNVERIAAELGIDAKCRCMTIVWSEEYDGPEYFEPYDVYETRAGNRILTIDADAVRRARPMGEFIRALLEAWR